MLTDLTKTVALLGGVLHDREHDIATINLACTVSCHQQKQSGQLVGLPSLNNPGNIIYRGRPRWIDSINTWAA